MIIFVVSLILYNFAFGNKNIAVQTICPENADCKQIALSKFNYTINH